MGLQLKLNGYVMGERAEALNSIGFSWLISVAWGLWRYDMI